MPECRTLSVRYRRSMKNRDFWRMPGQCCFNSLRYVLRNLCGQSERTGDANGAEKLQEDSVQQFDQHDVAELIAGRERNALNGNNDSDSSVDDYEHIDPVEVQEARLKAQQPTLDSGPP